MRFLTAVALALVMLWVPVDGVAQRDPLKGLTTMSHLVSIDWDDDIEGKSEAQFTQELETAFALGLLRAGVKLSDDPITPYLHCSTGIAVAGDLVAIAGNVSYSESVVPWAGPGVASSNDGFVASTWRRSVVATVGHMVLEGTTFGEWCAETFELAWRRANN